jgi:hypothetical protein
MVPASGSGKTPVIVDRSVIVDALIIVGLIVVAGGQALSVTTGLHLPPDPDLFRSAAITQTMVDGAWTADPFYAGESNWYNPLVPAVVAALHGLTGTPILELYARGGVMLNALIPLAFWALVRVLFGSGTAVAAVFTFLFLTPRGLPGWSTAGYWPWLFSGVFTQAVFYLSLLAVDSAGRSMRLSQWLRAGVALGVVFLGHTAPALIVGGVLVLTATRGWRHGCSARQSVLMLAAGLFVAGCVSFPIIMSVGVHYRFAVANDVLALYAYPGTEPENIVDLLRAHANAGGALALLGVGLLAFDRGRRKRVWVIGYWVIINALFLFLHYGRTALDSVGLRIPPIVTAFHFFIYADAIVTVFAGYALWRIVEAAARLASRLVFRSSSVATTWLTPSLAARALLLTVVLLSVRPALASRRAREDFDESRARALQYQSRPANQAIREWIRGRTTPGTVFLASPLMSLYVVAPAGGKVVSLDAVFANPYVNAASRERDQFTMEDRIHENDRAGYCAVAPRYQVRYVITDSKGGDVTVPAETFLEEALATDGIRIWRAPDCGPGNAR